jgi:sugar phosphate permease
MKQVLWPLAGTLLMQTVASLIFMAVPVLAPEIADDIGFDASRVGFYSAMVFAGAMPVSLVIAGVINRVGAVRVMQFGMFAMALAVAGPVLGSLWFVLASGVVVGLGYGPNTPAASHVLARFSRPQDRPLVFSIKQSGAPLGGFLAGLVIPWIVVVAGWHAALYAAGGLGLLAILLVQPLRRHADDDRDPAAKISVRQSVAQLKFLAASGEMKRLTFASFTYAGVQMCIFSFLVTYLVQRLDYSLVAAGAAFSAMQAAGVVARIFWGWVADRYVPARVVLSGIGVSAAVLVVVVAAFTPAWPFWLVSTVCACVGATVSGWNGVFLAEVARVAPPDQISAATGGTIFFTYFGLVVAPVVFSGLVAVTDSYALSFGVIAAFGLLASLLILPRQAPRVGTGNRI